MAQENKLDQDLMKIIVKHLPDWKFAVRPIKYDDGTIPIHHILYEAISKHYIRRDSVKLDYNKLLALAKREDLAGPQVGASIGIHELLTAICANTKDLLEQKKE